MSDAVNPAAAAKDAPAVAEKNASKLSENEDKQLRTAINDAEILITYNSVHNPQLDSGAVKDVLSIKEELKSGPPRIETITAFWLALNALSNAAAPATPSSISLASRVDAEGNPLNRRLFSNVYQRYRAVTFCFLFLAIFLNAYWIVAKQTGEKLDEAYKALQLTLGELNTNNALIEAAKNLPPTADPTPAQMKNQEILQSARAKVQDLKTKAGDLESSITGHFQVLRYVTFFLIDIENDDTGDQGRLAEIIIGYLRDIIGLTLAPLAFGGLGACVYVVRRIGELVAARAFDPDTGFNFNLRIYLGCIAGLAAAQFKIFGDTTSLTPLALAFIAGYAIEVFFSALDRLVGAFSGGSQKSIQNAGAR
jgi:hypothetical protein